MSNSTDKLGLKYTSATSGIFLTRKSSECELCVFILTLHEFSNLSYE
jgi:hypothetical protein